MRHIFSVIVVATLLVATAVEVIAGGPKWMRVGIITTLHPITGISIALPSSMKSFPVELPQ
jgi:hypothetical protein